MPFTDIYHPDIPDDVPGDDEWELLDQQFSLPNIVTGPDGALPLYRINGTYIYGNASPSLDVLDDVEWGRPPWLMDVFNRKMQKSKEKKSLADTGGQGSSQSSPGQSTNTFSTLGGLPGQ